MPDPDDQLRPKIEALEAQRAILGDEFVDTALALLRSQAQTGHIEAGGDLTARDVITGVQVRQGHLFAGVVNIYTAAPAPAATPADYTAALAAYLRHLLTTRQTLNLRGIRTERLLTIELEQVYVTLSALDPGREEAMLRRQGRLDEVALTGEKERARPRPVQELLAEQKRLVVLGAPGSGKTTFLSYLALSCARALAEEKPELAAERLGLLPGDIPLPIFLPLREFAAYLRGLTDPSRVGGGAPSLLLDYLNGYLERWQLKLPPDFFTRQLETGRALLLFDGLDEVANEDERARISEHISDFVNCFPDNRYVLTCRIRGYTGAARLGAAFTTCTVLDFSDEDIERFVQNWTLAVEAAKSKGDLNPTVRSEAARNAADLLQGVLVNPRLRALAINPLLLTVIALVHQYRARLPENRAELYHECTEVLLGYWETGKPGQEGKRLARFTGTELELDAGEKRAFIQPVAFTMHQQGLRELDKADLLAMLRRQFAERGYPPEKAGAMAGHFLEALALRSGLLREIEVGVYEFLHLTFQEYLAALSLTDQTDCEAYAAARAGDSWWKEVILLAAAALTGGGRGRVSRLVLGLLQAEQRDAGIVLAGECLVDIGRHRVQPEVWPAVEQALLELIGSPGASELTHWAAAGRTLGRLGDSRPGVTTLPPLLTEEIRGKFEYGQKKEIRETVPFRAGIYPVTNAQFKFFIDAKGYHNPAWWSKEGLEWLQNPPDYRRRPVEEPEYWRDERWNNPNHPVVGVSWYEAEAFCNWLTTKYGQTYRLPTEVEWERLARGEYGRQYPWGNDWEEGACNTRESGLKQTSAVGLFPGDESPTGARDCAGNVWEWCQDWYDKDGDFRVLRGGSWDYQRDNARCVTRSRNLPLGSNLNNGFRVVSPI